MSASGPRPRRAPHDRASLSVLVVLALATAAGPAVAADYSGLVTIKPAQVYMKNNRGRVVLAVLNNSSEVLDIDVTCTFYAADKTKLGSGRGQLARVPAHRSDTIEVANEIAQTVDSAACNVTGARK